MKIDGEKIAKKLLSYLKKEVKKLKTKPTLAIFLVGDSSEQKSFVKIKEKTAKKLGINFLLYHLKQPPSFEEFLKKIHTVASNKKVNGVVIQLPLPPSLDTLSIFDYLPHEKEIEGFSEKTKFLPPIGQAVLTILKSIFIKTKNVKDLFIKMNDEERLKEILKQKKIVIVGRGKTGGGPIGKTFNHFKINFTSINSKTVNPQDYTKKADIIISAVGKKVIFPTMLKPGVILINVGLRKEKGKLKGDYDENEIRKIASYYTPTPGGIGPVDVAYLYKNLIDAVKMQK